MVLTYQIGNGLPNLGWTQLLGSQGQQGGMRRLRKKSGCGKQHDGLLKAERQGFADTTLQVIKAIGVPEPILIGG
jgi:predicted esterase